MNIKLIATALTLLVLSTALFSSAYADERFSFEGLECYAGEVIITMAVPMPEDLTDAQREALSKRVCDSIGSREEPFAVCDTDTNCMYYDEYQKFGIHSIMVSHDEGDTRWLAATCLDDENVHIIDDPSELEVICKP